MRRKRNESEQLFWCGIAALGYHRTGEPRAGVLHSGRTAARFRFVTPLPSRPVDSFGVQVLKRRPQGGGGPRRESGGLAALSQGYIGREKTGYQPQSGDGAVAWGVKPQDGGPCGMEISPTPTKWGGEDITRGRQDVLELPVDVDVDVELEVDVDAEPLVVVAPPIIDMNGIIGRPSPPPAAMAIGLPITPLWAPPFMIVTGPPGPPIAEPAR